MGIESKGENSIERVENGSIETLERLSERYLEEPFVIDGVNPEAQENNKLVVESIEAAGENLAGGENKIFGISLSGSRVKGYNTLDSDIDLVMIVPEDAGDISFAYDEVRKQLDARGVSNRIDTMMDMFAQYDTETDPQKFIRRVDYESGDLVTLFGFCPYKNDNVALAQLSALEVMQQYPSSDQTLSDLNGWFEEYHLGERERIVQKLIDRLGADEKTVRSKLPPSLFEQRNQKFGLHDKKKMYQNLLNWYNNNEQSLQDKVMYKTYQGVKDQIRLGF